MDDSSSDRHSAAKKEKIPTRKAVWCIWMQQYEQGWSWAKYLQGQGHGEIDISFLIILHISTCGTYRNLQSSIFMFGLMRIPTH
jgi:hypothetical protein